MYTGSVVNLLMILDDLKVIDKNISCINSVKQKAVKIIAISQINMWMYVEFNDNCILYPHKIGKKFYDGNNKIISLFDVYDFPRTN